MEPALETLVIPKWGNRWTSRQIEEYMKDIESSFCFIGLMEPNKCRKKEVLHHISIHLKDAFLFCSRANIEEVLKTIIQVNEFINLNRKEKKIILFNMDIPVCNMDNFQLVLILALKNLLALLNIDETTKPLLASLCIIIVELINVQSPNASYYSETLHALIKHHINMSTERQQIYFEEKVLQATSSFVTSLPHHKSAKHLKEISDMLISNWSRDRKKAMIFQLNRIDEWNNHDCLVMASVINNYPNDAGFLAEVMVLPDRLCRMLIQKNVCIGANKVVQAITGTLDMEVWLIFADQILMSAPDDPASNDKFTHAVFAIFIETAVKKYGKPLYAVLRARESKESHLILCLHYCVKHGFIDLTSHGIDMCYLAWKGNNSPSDRYIIIQTLCVQYKKSIVVKPWMLDTIFSYLQYYIFDKEFAYMSELHYLLSHLYITIHRVIADERIYEPDKYMLIDRYGTFLNDLQLLCVPYIVLNGEAINIEFSVKIFHLIHKVFIKGDLIAKYHISAVDRFPQGECPFIKLATERGFLTLYSQNTWQMLCSTFIKGPKCYPEIPRLLQQWCSADLPDRNFNFKPILQEGIKLIEQKHDYELIEKGSLCLKMLLGHKTWTVDSIDVLDVINKGLVNTTVAFENVQKLCTILHNDPLYGVIKYAHIYLQMQRRSITDEIFIRLLFDKCEGIIKMIMNVCNTNNSVMTNLDDNLPTDIKIIEHTLSACLDVLVLISSVYSKFNQSWNERALKVMYEVISSTSMKKTVNDAAQSISKICWNALNLEDQKPQVVTKFLEFTLYSIYNSPDQLTTKIRRSPGHRLVIHAIIMADTRKNNPFLVRAMDFLLKLLEDSCYLSASSIASTLHTVEILISESCLKTNTSNNICEIGIHCINKLSSGNWQIKNAAIQVIQSLAHRLLGQPNDSGCRRNSIEDVFMQYPELANYFYTSICDADDFSMSDNVIAILSIMSESHCKSRVHITENLFVIVDSFLKKFITYINTSTSPYAIFAAKAFAALYPHIHIPFLICDIIEWLRIVFCKLKKNIFYTFISLLRALYKKFTRVSYVPYYKVGLLIIQSAIQHLGLFLEQYNALYEFSLFGLLSIKSSRINTAERMILDQLQKDDFYSRIWLHNNVPYVIYNIDIGEFSGLLTTILGKCSLSLQILCLDGIVSRCNELVSHSVADTVVLIVLDQFLQLQDVWPHLLICYSHTILLLLELGKLAVTEDLIAKLRSQYWKIDISNIYVVSVFITLLSHVDSYIEEDQKFIKKSIDLYQNAADVEDYDLHFHCSTTLKYLYKCVQVSDRHRLLKVAFILLLNQEASPEICKFISFIYKVKSSTTYTTLHNLISFKNLTNQLGGKKEACTFLVNLTIFIVSLKEPYENIGKFYLKKNPNICMHKHYLKGVILDQVELAFKVLPNRVLFKILITL